MSGSPLPTVVSQQPQQSAKSLGVRRAAVLCAMGALGLMAATDAEARERCRVARVAETRDRGAQRITVHTSCAPNFAAHKLADPPRIVIDVDGDADAFATPSIPVQAGVVASVDVHPARRNDGSLAARVAIGLRAETPCEVAREGQDIVVACRDGRLEQAAPLDQPTGDNKQAGFASECQGCAEHSGQTPPIAAAGQSPGGPPPSVEPQRQVADRSARLLGLERRAEGVAILCRGEMDEVVTELDHPPRFVVDLPAAAMPREPVALLSRPTWLKQVRLAPRNGGVRLVFDLEPNHGAALVAHEDGYVLTGHKLVSGAQAAAVTGIQFVDGRGEGGLESQVLVTLSGGSEVLPTLDTSNPHAFVLALPRTTLPSRLEKGLDTQASLGPVSLLSSFQAERSPPSTHLVASLDGPAAANLEPTPTGFRWRLRRLTPRPQQAARISYSSMRTAGFAEDADADVSARGNQSAEPGARLRNKRISLDVKDADIINVLRLISEETGENIIASDEVRGKVTMKLRNVSAEQALDTLLRVKGYDRVRTNDILRIASADTIQKERDGEVARKRALVEVEEVVIKMVTINYATASEVVDQLKPMLSGRGSVQVDARTNTLILQDISSNIDNLAELARRLDKQTPLVNIQARIVEADSTFVRDLGVQWGGAVKHTAVTGNPTGLYFPADITAQGTADLTTTVAGGAAAAAPSRYAVNLPASLTGSGAALGFILGSAGGSQLLDLRLSAMETNGNGKVISSPEVSTLDNRTARVSQGVSFAVSTVSAAGTNVKFIPAVLQLEVTPHVTNDGTVLLKLHVQKSAPDFANRSGAGDPSIQTKEAETEVLVKDGDTSVIGGILTRTTTETRNEVPFFSKIPLLGLLFREHAQRDIRSELLVFITPRIINRDESKIAAEAVVHSKIN